MSYDVDLIADPTPCPTCGRIDPPGPWDLPDPTYNLTAIFDLALTGEPFPNPEVNEFEVVILKKETDRLRGLRVLSGRKAKDTIKQLERALADMQDPAKLPAFKALEPSNGWGDLPGAIICIEKYLDAARKYPEYTWDIR